MVGLVTKVVTAPFRLLGSLIGVDSEDLGQFEFLAGRSDLTPPEQEKVLQLRQALQERPELAIEVSGAFDPAVDGPALQKIRLRTQIETRLGRAASSSGNDVEMLDTEIRDVLENLFTERFPGESLDELKAAHTAPPADKPDAEPVFDQLAYATTMWERLLAGEEIGAADLKNLAQDRAAAIRDAFLQDDAFDPARVVFTETREVESEDGEWVVMELGVATN